MTRHQLEHIIGAAAAISEDDEIVVVGSQAILGQFPDAPEELEGRRVLPSARASRADRPSDLEARLATMSLDARALEAVRGRIRADFAAS